MLKKTFTRLVLIGILAFALFFVLISASKVQQPMDAECTESGIKTETMRPTGEFIVESLVGSILVGTN